LTLTLPPLGMLFLQREAPEVPVVEIEDEKRVEDEERIEDEEIDEELRSDEEE